MLLGQVCVFLCHITVERGGLHEGVDVVFPRALAVRTHQSHIQQSCSSQWWSLSCCCCCYLKSCYPDWNLLCLSCYLKDWCCWPIEPMPQKPSLLSPESSFSLMVLDVYWGSFSSFCSHLPFCTLLESVMSTFCDVHTSNISS